jgi:hypothetical protein
MQITKLRYLIINYIFPVACFGLIISGILWSFGEIFIHYLDYLEIVANRLPYNFEFAYRQTEDIRTVYFKFVATKQAEYEHSCYASLINCGNPFYAHSWEVSHRYLCEERAKILYCELTQHYNHTVDLLTKYKNTQPVKESGETSGMVSELDLNIFFGWVNKINECVRAAEVVADGVQFILWLTRTQNPRVDKLHEKIQFFANICTRVTRAFVFCYNAYKLFEENNKKKK